MIGSLVHKLRWWIVLAWLVAAVALVAYVPSPDPTANEQMTFLPADAPYSQATAAMRQAFPNTGLSEATVIVERPGAGARLTQRDMDFLSAVAHNIRQGGASAKPADSGADAARDPGPEQRSLAKLLQGVTVVPPQAVPIRPNPLVSPAGENGQAAIIRVSVPYSFITTHSSEVVRHIRGVLERAQQQGIESPTGGTVTMPAGLQVAVTGSGGFGYDYGAAAKESHTNTVYVTLIAVTIILLLVYRAPLAALVPLIGISIAALVAIKLLTLGQHVGLHVGTAESIFVVVLLYGAGIDYSLLLTSRFREFLDSGLTVQAASSRGLSATFGAILIAAATNILSLLMLCFAKYGIFRSTGPAVAIALGVALLAALTLVPAMHALLGKRLFWPSRRMGHIGGRRLWPALAGLVTRRPWAVLVVTLLLFAVPVIQGMNMTWVYDTLAMLQPQSPGGVGNGAAGVQMAQRHWPVGEIAPVEVLVTSDKPLSPQQWKQVSAEMTAALLGMHDGHNPGHPIRDVRSLSQPLGNGKELPTRYFASMVQGFVQRLYLGKDRRAIRLEAVMSERPFKLEALGLIGELQTRLQETAQDAVDRVAPGAGVTAKVHIAGPSAEMNETRTTTYHDFLLIGALVMIVIFVMIMVLLRDAVLSLFMLISTVISYFATIGITYWVFVSLGHWVAQVVPTLGWNGAVGLDWKVQVFLFVVMVSVGQDYNIFFTARLVQESVLHKPREASHQAIIFTGPVISSCGVIMGATLGSLMAGSLVLLTQLGFALALGMLIDTFIVRPLMLPAFCVITGRTGRSSKLLH